LPKAKTSLGSQASSTTALRAQYRWPQTPFGAAKFGAEAHDFSAEETGADLGSELDLLGAIDLRQGVALEAKIAIFDGGDAGPADRRKVWLAMTFDF
jgi:hypothetical protein